MDDEFVTGRDGRVYRTALGWEILRRRAVTRVLVSMIVMLAAPTAVVAGACVRDAVREAIGTAATWYRRLGE